jgi:hypothetical protein
MTRRMIVSLLALLIAGIAVPSTGSAVTAQSQNDLAGVILNVDDLPDFQLTDYGPTPNELVPTYSAIFQRGGETLGVQLRTAGSRANLDAVTAAAQAAYARRGSRQDAGELVAIGADTVHLVVEAPASSGQGASYADVIAWRHKGVIASVVLISPYSWPDARPHAELQQAKLVATFGE